MKSPYRYHRTDGARPGGPDTTKLRIASLYWPTDRDVPVGATGIPMRTRVKLKEGLDGELARRMLGSAERYCPTVQTLRNGVNVTTDFRHRQLIIVASRSAGVMGLRLAITGIQGGDTWQKPKPQ
jgi:hypothetical protein